jgi:hypothetical protein
MPVTLAKVTLNSSTGLPRDAVVNNFVYSTPLVADTMSADLIAFYAHIGAFFGRTLAAGSAPHMIETYDISGHLDGSPHGSPTSTTMFAVPASAGAISLPRQVCIVVPYHADFGVTLEHGASATRPTTESAIDQGAPPTHPALTRPRANLRGRLFLGPWNTLAQDSVNGLGFSAELITAIQLAVHELIARGFWAIWSRASASVHPVLAAAVDLAWQTQRRRVIGGAGRTAFLS